ncbi:MAG: hypothetical protein O3A96_10370 [Proteobacteria bacterium]|nr:hypothetical protein [Pseudomonadota bacterium]
MAKAKITTAGDGKAKTDTPAAKSEDVKDVKDVKDAKTADSPAPAAGEVATTEAASDPAAGYTRGENQKPISRAYKSNWDDIFGKKKRGTR